MGIQWFDRDTLEHAIPNFIRDANVVLDIGCGIRPQGFFKPKIHIFCEPSPEYVHILQEKFLEFSNVLILQATAQEAIRLLPDKSIDSVFMIDLIEHLEKEDGKHLILECERVARQQIIIFTPLGFLPQDYERGDTDAWGLQGGEWQVHKSGWQPEDFDASWAIFASRSYHLTNAKGKPLDPPAGAFWAIKNFHEAGFSQEMDMLPLVSVITPAYNRAGYLDETIQSVLNQDYKSIEYIVLNDGSTDKTEEVLKKYAGRLTSETHENMGETRTVNKGLAMAHGEIIAIVNSDDPLLPGAISSAVSFLKSHPEIIVAYPDWNYIGPDSKVTGHIQVREYDYLYMVRHHHCSVGPGAFIRRKALEFAEGRDPDFKYVADFEYWLRLGLYGKFARVPKTLATFRVHPDSASLSGRGKAMAEEHIRLIRKFYSRPGLPPEVLKVRAEAFCWAYLVASVTAGPNRRVALGYYLRAMYFHPSSLFKNLEVWQFLLVTIVPKPVLNLLLMGWSAIRSIKNKLRGLIQKS